MWQTTALAGYKKTRKRTDSLQESYIRTATVENSIEVPQKIWNNYILWPPDVKSWLIGKDPDAGEDWRQEEKGATEDEMVGWNHQLDGHESVQTPGDSEGQGSMGATVYWITKSRTLLNDWTTTIKKGTWHLLWVQFPFEGFLSLGIFWMSARP